MDRKSQIEFIKIIDKLMLMNYPDCLQIGEPNSVGLVTYKLESLDLKLEIYRRSFNLILEPKRLKIIDLFSSNKDWYVPHLKFDIRYRTSGKTYSYPKLREYLGDNTNDLLMTATYIFNCLDFTIKFLINRITDCSADHITIEGNRLLVFR